MGVFTFVCKSSAGAWTAKQFNGDLEGCGDSTYSLQRNLVNVALSADNSGCVQTSFSHVLPDSGVFQVIIGGGGDGASFGGAAAASAPSEGAAAAEAPAAEEKKEESDEEDFTMSLFDD